ncbi:hypothetical protein P4679_30830 [Priestia megaterium]|uniref:hypothetical protein n=1 Tax=Priestia megaterium TaxID=1404 RepID=UPI002E1E1B7C|nr:hypothetical protein [Priestia megaterium]
MIKLNEALSIPIEEKGVNMKKAVLLVLFLVNLFFIVKYLITFEAGFSALWLPIFIIGIILSIVFMVRSKTERSSYSPILSIGVLVTSLSSLGALGFHYFLSNLMG